MGRDLLFIEMDVAGFIFIVDGFGFHLFIVISFIEFLSSQPLSSLNIIIVAAFN